MSDMPEDVTSFILESNFEPFPFLDITDTWNSLPSPDNHVIGSIEAWLSQEVSMNPKKAGKSTIIEKKSKSANLEKEWSSEYILENIENANPNMMGPMDPDVDVDDEAKDPTFVLRASNSTAIKKGKERKKYKKLSRSPLRAKQRRERIPSEGQDDDEVPRCKLTRWLYQLLESPAHNRTVLHWMDRSSLLFKIDDQKKLAKLWGKTKGKPNMTYENFSRSLRYYYKRREMVVVRKKLQYRFGPAFAL